MPRKPILKVKKLPSATPTGAPTSMTSNLTSLKARPGTEPDPSPEWARFLSLARGLVGVSKDELDAARADAH